MSYDEQAARRVVEERVTWALSFATAVLEPFRRVDTASVSRLAVEMMRPLPMVVPETPNDA